MRPNFFFSLVSLISLARGLIWHCADFSSLVNLENSGISYKDSGTTKAFETILASHGANLARIRIWTSTNSTDYSLSYGLALAKRAHAAGMSLLVDLHYSDTWADEGHQSIPSGWPTTLSGLNTQIYTYTENVVSAFGAQGTPITILSIGNEINDGLLWPVGQISVNGYSPASQLLNSAANGAREAQSSIQIMIHLADGWESLSYWYQGIFIAGELSTSGFSIMGFSFYPFYGTGATLSALQSNLKALVSAYGKEVMVVETDWPESCSGVALSDTAVPVSTAGQENWVADIRSVLSGISGGLGICYWEPGWIGNAGLGSACADNLLVDGTGATRASITMFSASM